MLALYFNNHLHLNLQQLHNQEQEQSIINIKNVFEFITSYSFPTTLQKVSAYSVGSSAGS